MAGEPAQDPVGAALSPMDRSGDVIAAPAINTASVPYAAVETAEGAQPTHGAQQTPPPPPPPPSYSTVPGDVGSAERKGKRAPGSVAASITAIDALSGAARGAARVSGDGGDGDGSTGGGTSEGLDAVASSLVREGEGETAGVQGNAPVADPAAGSNGGFAFGHGPAVDVTAAAAAGGVPVGNGEDAPPPGETEPWTSVGVKTALEGAGEEARGGTGGSFHDLTEIEGVGTDGATLAQTLSAASSSYGTDQSREEGEAAEGVVVEDEPERAAAEPVAAVPAGKSRGIGGGAGLPERLALRTSHTSGGCRLEDSGEIYDCSAEVEKVSVPVMAAIGFRFQGPAGGAGAVAAAHLRPTIVVSASSADSGMTTEGGDLWYKDGAAETFGEPEHEAAAAAAVGRPDLVLSEGSVDSEALLCDPDAHRAAVEAAAAGAGAGGGRGWAGGASSEVLAEAIPAVGSLLAQSEAPGDGGVNPASDGVQACDAGRAEGVESGAREPKEQAWAGRSSFGLSGPVSPGAKERGAGLVGQLVAPTTTMAFLETVAARAEGEGERGGGDIGEGTGGGSPGAAQPRVVQGVDVPAVEENTGTKAGGVPPKSTQSALQVPDGLISEDGAIRTAGGMAGATVPDYSLSIPEPSAITDEQVRDEAGGETPAAESVHAVAATSAREAALPVQEETLRRGGNVGGVWLREELVGDASDAGDTATDGDSVSANSVDTGQVDAIADEARVGGAAAAAAAATSAREAALPAQEETLARAGSVGVVGLREEVVVDASDAGDTAADGDSVSANSVDIGQVDATADQARVGAAAAVAAATPAREAVLPAQEEALGRAGSVRVVGLPEEVVGDASDAGDTAANGDSVSANSVDTGQVDATADQARVGTAAAVTATPAREAVLPAQDEALGRAGSVRVVGLPEEVVGDASDAGDTAADSGSVSANSVDTGQVDAIAYDARVGAAAASVAAAAVITASEGSTVYPSKTAMETTRVTSPTDTIEAEAGTISERPNLQTRAGAEEPVAAGRTAGSLEECAITAKPTRPPSRAAATAPPAEKAVSSPAGIPRLAAAYDRDTENGVAAPGKSKVGRSATPPASAETPVTAESGKGAAGSPAAVAVASRDRNRKAAARAGGSRAGRVASPDPFSSRSGSGAWPGPDDSDGSGGITLEEAAAFMGCTTATRFASGSSWGTTTTSIVADGDRFGGPMQTRSPASSAAAAAIALALAGEDASSRDPSDCSAGGFVSLGPIAGADHFLSPASDGFEHPRKRGLSGSEVAFAPVLTVGASHLASSGVVDDFLSMGAIDSRGRSSPGLGGAAAPPASASASWISGTRAVGGNARDGADTPGDAGSRPDDGGGPVAACRGSGRRSSSGDSGSTSGAACEEAAMTTATSEAVDGRRDNDRAGGEEGMEVGQGQGEEKTFQVRLVAVHGDGGNDDDQALRPALSVSSISGGTTTAAAAAAAAAAAVAMLGPGKSDSLAVEEAIIEATVGGGETSGEGRGGSGAGVDKSGGVAATESAATSVLGNAAGDGATGSPSTEGQGEPPRAKTGPRAGGGCCAVS